MSANNSKRGYQFDRRTLRFVDPWNTYSELTLCLEAISKNGFWLNTPEAYKNQGGAEFQLAGVLKYVEDLKRGTNTEIGPKDFFEMASNESDLRCAAMGRICLQIADNLN